MINSQFLPDLLANVGIFVIAKQGGTPLRVSLQQERGNL